MKRKTEYEDIQQSKIVKLSSYVEKINKEINIYVDNNVFTISISKSGNNDEILIIDNIYKRIMLFNNNICADSFHLSTNIYINRVYEKYFLNKNKKSYLLEEKIVKDIFDIIQNYSY